MYLFYLSWKSYSFVMDLIQSWKEFWEGTTGEVHTSLTVFTVCIPQDIFPNVYFPSFSNFVFFSLHLWWTPTRSTSINVLTILTRKNERTFLYPVHLILKVIKDFALKMKGIYRYHTNLHSIVLLHYIHTVIR